jgi:hypothetical protein
MSKLGKSAQSAGGPRGKKTRGNPRMDVGGVSMLSLIQDDLNLYIAYDLFYYLLIQLLSLVLTAQGYDVPCPVLDLLNIASLKLPRQTTGSYPSPSRQFWLRRTQSFTHYVIRD